MDSLSSTKLGRLSKLRLKKYRDLNRMFIAEGEKSVRDVSISFSPRILVAQKEWIANHRNEELVSKAVEVYSAEDNQLKKLSTLTSPPSVIGIFEMPDPIELTINSNELYLMIDGVQDPGNMGTIIRTADWFGIHRIIASPSTVDIYNPKTIQATMGSLARVNVVYADLPGVLRKFPDMPVYGTLLNGENIYKTELSSYGFIVMGNEGNGVSPEVRKCLTKGLLLPPYPLGNEHAESLNVGVATALVVAEFRRREIK